MVKSTGIQRKVDELGRILLPMEVRKLFQIMEKDTLEIFVDEETHQVLLQKVTED